MTLSRDGIARRFGIMPDRQTVEYFPASGEGDDQFLPPQEVSNLERRPISIDERQFAGFGMEVEAETWHAWRTELEQVGIAPKIGDKFVDNDSPRGTWHVASVSLEMLRNRWRFVCTKVLEG